MRPCRCRSVSRHQNVVRDISAPVHYGTGSRTSRDNSDPEQFRRGTAAPVIRLKLGAEVSKCVGAEVFGHFGPGPTNIARAVTATFDATAQP